MKGSSFIVRTKLFFKYFFDFKKIEIQEIDFIDIVVKEKSLLLLSWSFRRKYYLSIPSLHVYNVSPCNSVVLKMPENIDKVELVISSSWRAKKITIGLKRFELSREASNFIIQQLNPMKIPHVLLEYINVQNTFVGVPNIPSPSFKHITVSMIPKHVSINCEALIFSENN